MLNNKCYSLVKTNLRVFVNGCAFKQYNFPVFLNEARKEGLVMLAKLARSLFLFFVFTKHKCDSGSSPLSVFSLLTQNSIRVQGSDVPSGSLETQLPQSAHARLRGSSSVFLVRCHPQDIFHVSFVYHF